MSVDVATMGDLDIHVVRRDGTPLFVVREVDSKAIRQTPGFTKGKSEQSIRSEIRASILALKLRSIKATKSEIQLLKDQDILGKRAPSAMLLDGKDMISLLMHYKSHKYTRMWQIYLEDDAKVHTHNADIASLIMPEPIPPSKPASQRSRPRARKALGEKRKRLKAVKLKLETVVAARAALSDSDSSSSPDSGPEQTPAHYGGNTHAHPASGASTHRCTVEGGPADASTHITCPVCRTFKRNQDRPNSSPLASVFPSSSPPLQSYDRVPSMLAPMTPLTPLQPFQMIAPVFSPLPPLTSQAKNSNSFSWANVHSSPTLQPSALPSPLSAAMSSPRWPSTRLRQPSPAWSGSGNTSPGSTASTGVAGNSSGSASGAATASTTTTTETTTTTVTTTATTTATTTTTKMARTCQASFFSLSASGTFDSGKSFQLKKSPPRTLPSLSSTTQNTQSQTQTQPPTHDESQSQQPQREQGEVEQKRRKQNPAQQPPRSIGQSIAQSNAKARARQASQSSQPNLPSASPSNPPDSPSPYFHVSQTAKDKVLNVLTSIESFPQSPKLES